MKYLILLLAFIIFSSLIFAFFGRKKINLDDKSKSIYDIDKVMIYDYLHHRYKFGSDKGNNRPWTPSSINSSYRRIRAWYNWMVRKPNTELKFGLLNGMGIELPKIELDTTTFTKKESTAVYKFMETMEDDLDWGWFVPILKTLLLTGGRIDEVVNMKMDDVDLVNCPRCGKTMRRFFDISANKLKHEECDEYGKFYDAGEFTVWAQSHYL